MTDRDQIRDFVHDSFRHRLRTYTSVDKILDAKDGETWASLIVKSLLDTLTYDGSVN